MILLLLISFTLSGKTVRLTNGEWAPYLSEKMPDYGTASKVVTDAFKAVGIDVKYGFFPWKRAFKIAENGKWDGSVIWSKAAKREKTFYYSKEPVLNLKTVFFYKKGSGFKYTKMADLKGKKIGITLGYNYGPDFNEAVKNGVFKTDKAPEDATNLKKIFAGRIDGFACNEDVGKKIISKIFPGKESMFETAKVPLNTKGYYLILNKKNPANKELMKKFDEGFKKIGK